MKMPICKNDIVVSLKGHDTKTVYLVIESDDAHLLLCDGKIRKLENPKRKNPKHVQKIGECVNVNTPADNNSVLSNSKIRKMLFEYKVM